MIGGAWKNFKQVEGNFPKMTYNCHGVCEFYKTRKIPTSKKYENGQKRCSLCEVFLATLNLRCPCCNSMLRSKSRKNKKDLYYH